MNWKKIVLPIVIVVAAFFVMQGLASMKTDKTRKQPAVRTKIVETETVSLQNMPIRITAYGRVKSSQPIQLYSEVSGILEYGKIPFQDAQSFSRGDLLLKVDDRQAIFGLNSKKSELLTALSSFLPEIKINFPEQEYLKWQSYFDAFAFDSKVAELPDTDNSKVKLYLARFNVYKLYFAVKDLEIALDKHYFYAPFSGSIASVNLHVGSSVRNGSHLGEIVNLESLEVEVQVNVSDVQWIDRSRPAVLTSADVSGNWNGEISRVGSKVNDKTQTVPIFISIPSSSNVNLLDGTFVEAHITGQSIESTIAIPRKALYEDKYVYIIEDEKLARREVSIIRQEDNMLYVRGGIVNGDILITETMQGIAPGMPAKSKNVSEL